MSNYAVVITTTETTDDAKELAREILDGGLAACVQITGIDSLYMWKGKMAEEAETLLLIKTRADLYDDLEALVRRVHKYETPELIRLGVDAGLPAYLTWIDDVTSPKS